MKKVISVAAAMTLLSTGAFAFDSLANGNIVTKNVSGEDCKKGIQDANWLPEAIPSAQRASKLMAATYQIDGVNTAITTSNLKLSDGVLDDGSKSNAIQGDALIFPQFSQEDGSSTEIVFRNMTRNAANEKGSGYGIVAKVVIYSADTSRELRDFNVYLSKNDAFRFTIKDGKVTTTDESFMKSAIRPHYERFDATNPSAKDTATPVGYKKVNGVLTKLDKEEEFEITKLDEKTGYVVVYAMAQAKKLTGDEGYHQTNGHVELFKDYRIALDNRRSGWRLPYSKTAANTNPLCNGVLSRGTSTINVPSVAPYTKAGDFEFTDPSPKALSGVVTISMESSEDKNINSDMVLPATAIENFTDGNLMLWTEGEYASLQDRRFKVLPTTTTAIYDEASIREDAKAFLTSGAMYSFEKDSVNKLLFTQPYKRILVQLGNDDRYWDYTYFNDTTSVKPYGGFSTDAELYDEAEARVGQVVLDNPVEEVPIISPAGVNPDAPDAPKLVYDELAIFTDKADLQRLDNDQKDATRNPSKFYKGNGFGYVRVSGNIPAVVTQQMGSIVNGTNQMNWVYVPFNN